MLQGHEQLAAHWLSGLLISSDLMQCISIRYSKSGSTTIRRLGILVEAEVCKGRRGRGSRKGEGRSKRKQQQADKTSTSRATHCCLDKEAPSSDFGLELSRIRSKKVRMPWYTPIPIERLAVLSLPSRTMHYWNSQRVPLLQTYSNISMHARLKKKITWTGGLACGPYPLAQHLHRLIH